MAGSCISIGGQKQNAILETPHKEKGRKMKQVLVLVFILLLGFVGFLLYSDAKSDKSADIKEERKIPFSHQCSGWGNDVTCIFTNDSNKTIQVCGYGIAYRMDNPKEYVTSGVFCSGPMKPKYSTKIEDRFIDATNFCYSKKERKNFCDLSWRFKVDTVYKEGEVK